MKFIFSILILLSSLTLFADQSCPKIQGNYANEAIKLSVLQMNCESLEFNFEHSDGSKSHYEFKMDGISRLESEEAFNSSVFNLNYASETLFHLTYTYVPKNPENMEAGMTRKDSIWLESGILYRKLEYFWFSGEKIEMLGKTTKYQPVE